MAKVTKEERHFITNFKRNYPIQDWLGDPNGHWKWRQVSGCIDLRYGHKTLAQAQRARGKAAREAWQLYLWEQEEIECPRCHRLGAQGVIYQTGECAACLDRFKNDWGGVTHER